MISCNWASRHRVGLAFALAALAFGCSDEGDESDDVIILNDFEGTDWGDGWVATGNAFVDDNGNARKPPRMGWAGRLTGTLGGSLVDTFVNDEVNGLTLEDAATGTLASPAFQINRRYLNFAIDGGSFSPLSNAKTTVEVFVDGALIQFYTGDGAFPLQLRAHSVDLDAYAGRSLTLRITDDSTDGFGFIAVDQITLADTAAETPDQVVTSFEDATALISAGWSADGAFAGPSDPADWAGTSRDSSGGDARAIGVRALSTCEIMGPGTDCAEATGSVTSAPFTVRSPFLNFAISGGEGVQEVGIEVLDAQGDTVVFYQPDDCTSRLDGDGDWHFFDLSGQVGEQVRVRIFDNATTGCGHVTVDHIYLSRVSRGVAAMTRIRTPSDEVRVTVADDGFSDVIATFDDPRQLVTDGWMATGDFANPMGALSWAGTTEEPDSARVGIAAVSTCELAGGECDGPTGELRSPRFTVNQNFMSFLMSGGNGMAAVGLELLDADENVVARYSPNDCNPSYINDDMDWHSIDVSRFVGEDISLRLYDNASGGCGFVSFDHFYQSATGRGDEVAIAMPPVNNPGFTNVSTTAETFSDVITGFEEPTVMLANGWMATGAFANPVDDNGWVGTTNNPEAARIGDRAVGTCEIGGADCDGPTGTLMSPPVTVNQRYWSFLMSGGNGMVDVGVDLLDSDGEIVAMYRPNDCTPSYVNNDDDWHHIDMQAFVGQQVRIRLQDNESGGCGFVSFDHFHQTADPRGDLVAIATSPNGGTPVINVTITPDALDDVIATFDNPAMMLASGWMATGAFVDPANQDAWSGTARTSNFEAARVGERAVGTCEIGGGGCDEPTGTLISPLITVNSPFWSFLMAGGNGAVDVGLDILDRNDNIIASYRPNTCGPSFIDGDDDWSNVDMTAFVGQQVRLRLQDNETGGCGFVSFDHFYQSANGRGTTVAIAEMPSNQSAVNVTTSTDAFTNVIASFDDPRMMVMNGWVATGAFANPMSAGAWSGTATTANPAAARVGAQAVGTCEIGGAGCDAPTGTLTSPPFAVVQPFLSFLMAGGDGNANVGMEIIDAGGTVLAAFRPSTCGPSHIDGDDDWQHLDLSALVGRQVRLRIYDNETGGCGFISFDHFYLSRQGRGNLAGLSTPTANASLNADAILNGQVIATFDDPRAMLASGWTATGGFANPMSDGAWAGTATVSNAAAARIGTQAVSTCELAGGNCDGPTGDLTSPLITVNARYLNFMMAGGGAGVPVGIEVLDTSNNVIAGFAPDSCGPSFIDGDEDWHWIDLDGQIGNDVRIRIFDRSSGGCGFVSFDHLYLSDAIRGPSLTPQTEGIVIGDFENAQTMIAAGWTGTGAFAAPLSPDAWAGTARLTNVFAARVGRGAVSTCEIGGAGCDAPTGELRSPAFTVNARYLNFAMGGGNGTAPVGVEVLDANDMVLASFRPNQCGPSYVNGRDDWHHIDLMAFQGQTVRLRVFDDEPGGCGFVTFDHFFLSDTPEGSATP